VSSTAPQVRWGIIGCGQIAHDKALPGIQHAANAELVALAEPDPARLERAHAAAPQARTYQRPEDLLADADVQAVYIATPNHLHAEWTIAAARAGKHILCEKPMAMNAAEGADMVAAADRAGVQLMIAYMTLFNPAYQMAKQLVASGALGELVFVRGRHSYPMRLDQLSPAARWRLDPEQGGGPLLDVAVYPTMSLRDLTGQRIQSLAATGAVRRLHELTDCDSVVYTFLLEDGTPGVIEGCFTHTASLIELEGTQGWLALQGHISQGIGGRLEVALRFPGQRGAGQQLTHEVVSEHLPHFYNYLREVEHCSQCILTGEEPVSSGRRAVAELAVADAVRQSLRSGQRVALTW
jgi:D-xylose 1-dehydrogenase (NADP+, D-xylono-1,5-lactone-forming)